MVRRGLLRFGGISWVKAVRLGYVMLGLVELGFVAVWQLCWVMSRFDKLM